MKHFLAVSLAAAGVQSLSACDLCAVYSAAEAHGEIGRGVYAGVAEQFTHFATLQEDGHKVPDEVGQRLDSSITQIFAGYNFNSRVGVQLNVPLISRSVRRPEGFAIDSGTESGLCDILLTSHLNAYRYEAMDWTFSWNLLGGIKLPTGDSGRIAEELDEVEVPGAPESGIHGHDLTLGSGSVDGLVGSSVYARWKRLFIGASVQYTIRTEGDYNYQFANDLTWSGGPGVLLALKDDYTISLQANCTGETKGKDTFDGEKAADTGITAVYLGPEIVATWKDKLSAELGLDLPVLINNTALQLVPDYRVRAALTWHF
jgi:hypothetical protein